MDIYFASLIERFIELNRALYCVRRWYITTIAFHTRLSSMKSKNQIQIKLKIKQGETFDEI